jgi:hypothetical protein
MRISPKALYGLVSAGLVLLIVCPAHTPAQSPRISGIILGMSAEDVGGVLGAPELVEQSLGMRFWEYRSRGLTVIWRDDIPGVSAIVVSKRAAGAINGVRVGDSGRAISDNWGPPLRVRSAGRFLDFAGRAWTLSAEMANGKAIEITLLGARDLSSKRGH